MEQNLKIISEESNEIFPYTEGVDLSVSNSVSFPTSSLILFVDHRNDWFQIIEIIM